MKLSEKGLKRLLDVAFDGDEFYQSNALQIEFEPDDFDGCCQNGNDHVVLTIEEAKALLRRIPVFQMSADWMHPIEVLKARIKQKEMCNG